MDEDTVVRLGDVLRQPVTDTLEFGERRRNAVCRPFDPRPICGQLLCQRVGLTHRLERVGRNCVDPSECVDQFVSESLAGPRVLVALWEARAERDLPTLETRHQDERRAENRVVSTPSNWPRSRYVTGYEPVQRPVLGLDVDEHRCVSKYVGASHHVPAPVGRRDRYDEIHAVGDHLTGRDLLTAVRRHPVFERGCLGVGQRHVFNGARPL
ncbi:MAG: hypothetical protein J07HB67_02576 [halophilic archaeon J07HB67]|nr:MAG: hypothetical protein J07HB67_02576 [halophilic archaeon J07HB67]